MTEATELAVLHVVRLTGVVEADDVSGRLDADAALVEAVLEDLGRQELVRRSEGMLSGWSLTPAGRARGEELLAAELDAGDSRAPMEAVYGGFLELNQAVLQACSDWQVVSFGEEPVLNTHEDPAHDEAVLERLSALHLQATEVLAVAEAFLARFGGYRPRLGNALARARAGELEWVTKPLIDSYHTVWFELHEDLLATLGRRRTDERDNGAPRATDDDPENDSPENDSPENDSPENDSPENKAPRGDDER